MLNNVTYATYTSYQHQFNPVLVQWKWIVFTSPACLNSYFIVISRSNLILVYVIVEAVLISIPIPIHTILQNLLRYYYS